MNNFHKCLLTALLILGILITNIQVFALDTTPANFKYSGYVMPDLSFSDNVSQQLKSGFTVKIEGTDLETKTDGNGYFEISNIPNLKNVTINISKTNFLTRQLSSIAGPIDMHFGTKQIPIPMWIGDMDNDNAINISDIFEITKSFNSVLGSEKYNSSYDINQDDAVNLSDIMIIAKHFNSISSTYPFFNSENEMDLQNARKIQDAIQR